MTLPGASPQMSPNAFLAWERYLALPSVQHLVLVSQREPRVEVYTRESDGSFHFHIHEPGDTIRLERIGAEIGVDELYEGVFDLPGGD